MNVQALTLGSCEYDLIWKQRCNQIKRVHTGLGWAWIPLLIPVSLEEEEILDTETHRHMQRKMPCEDGDRQECCKISFTSDTMNKLELKRKAKKRDRDWGYASKRQGVPRTVGNHQKLGERHRFSLKAPKETSLLTPWFWTFSWRNAETATFCCFRTLSLWYFVKAALGSQYDTWVHWKKTIRSF